MIFIIIRFFFYEIKRTQLGDVMGSWKSNHATEPLVSVHKTHKEGERMMVPFCKCGPPQKVLALPHALSQSPNPVVKDLPHPHKGRPSQNSLSLDPVTYFTLC